MRSLMNYWLKNLIFSKLDPLEVKLYQMIYSKPLLKSVGKNLAASQRVTVITPTNKDCYLKNIIANFLRQTINQKELIIILNSSQLNLSEWSSYVSDYENIRVFQLDDSTSTGACINFGVKQASGNFIARFDDDDYFGPEYLETSLLYFEISDASVIGKMSHFIFFTSLHQLAICDSGKGFKYSDYLPGGTQIIKRDVFDSVLYPDGSLAEDVYFNKACLEHGFKLYSGDPFHFIRFRNGNKHYHTWKIEDEEFLNLCNPLTISSDPIRLVSSLV